jgi:hypothetical protein
MAEVDSPQERCLKRKRAGWNTSGCVGLEPYGAEVVPWSQAHVRVESGRQPPEQAMVGSVPPSSMHSISSAVMSARPAKSVTLRPSTTAVVR